MVKNPGIDAFKQCTFSRFGDHHGIEVDAVHYSGNTDCGTNVPEPLPQPTSSTQRPGLRDMLSMLRR